MDIMELGAIGELVGGVAVIGSLIYVGLQVRRNTKAVLATTFQEVSRTSATFSAELVGPVIGPIFEKVVLGPDPLTPGERLRFGVFMRGVFRNFENYHYQVENDLLDRGVYEGYHNTLVDFLKIPFFREWWPAQRSGYGPVFREAVDRIAEDSRDAESVWKTIADAKSGEGA